MVGRSVAAVDFTDEVLLTNPLACLNAGGAQEQTGIGVGMTVAP